MSAARRRQLRLLNMLASAAVGLALVVIGACLYGATMETPWLRYANLPFPVMGPVAAGDALQLTVMRCNDSRVTRSYLVTHQLRNVVTGISVLLPDTVVEIVPGCTKSVSLLNVVPRDTPPGRYIVTGRALVHGLFGEHSVSWESAPFDVLPERN